MNLTSPPKTTSPETPEEVKTVKMSKIFTVLIVVVSLVALAAGSIFFFSAPKSSSELENNNSDTSSNASENKVEFNSFTVFIEDSILSMSFNLSGLGENESVEWLVEDSKRKVVAQGLEDTEGVVRSTIDKEATNGRYVLKYRVYDDASDGVWATALYATFGESTNNNSDNSSIKINEEYFDTPWAQKTEFTPEALLYAANVATGATTWLNNGAECYLIEEFRVQAGELPEPPKNISRETLTVSALQESEKSMYFAWMSCV